MRFLPLALVCLVAACSASPAPVDAVTLERALVMLVTRPELAGGRIGVHVLDGAHGTVLAEHAADRGFATASNMKLLSSVVGLQTLGPAHTFATELWQRGQVDDGVLRGELRLVGHGDPSFGLDPRVFVACAEALRAQGITRIVGRVVGDDTWLGREHRGLGWQWDYLDEDYAAPFGALCCGGNTVAVSVRVTAGAAAVTSTPAVGPAPQVDVAIVPAGQRSELRVQRPLGRDRIEVTGSLAADAKPRTVHVAVHEPAAFAAAVLVAELRAHGLVVDEVADVPVVGAPLRIVAWQSPPLRELLVPLLRHSDNLHAEQVWRCAARAATGVGDTAAAAAHATAVLRQFGLDPRGLVLADGSGLSRRNLVQPRHLTALLANAQAAPWYDDFVHALPLAGGPGTLRNRFADGPARGRVRAKTGFIARVVCLSGYVPRPGDGAAPLVFSVMLNDFTCSDDEAKAAVDAFVQELARAVGWTTPALAPVGPR